MSKHYRLGERVSYRRLTESLSNVASRMLRGGGHDKRSDDATSLWALSDISFDVPHGQVLGLIGRNGAGKSTLLKILSRITTMTSGEVKLRGRVGSLLEVGTGFHPELSGRDNIFLNGAILGMKRQEIRRHFDSIVEFAGIERFLDTPVKRYSSGMYMRLAFAVAAHLECEIMLVDEVLAVGDASFQKKCLGKMSDVASSGRTVLFVSHNMAAVQALCQRVILLDQGGLRCEGAPAEVVSRYMMHQRDASMTTAVFPEPAGDWAARIVQARILDEAGVPTTEILMGQDFLLEMQFEVRSPLQDPSFGFIIQSNVGQNLLRVTSAETVGEVSAAKSGGTIRIRVRNLNLLPGLYNVVVALANANQRVHRVDEGLQFLILEHDVYPTGKVPASDQGIMFAPCEWSFSYH